MHKTLFIFIFFLSCSITLSQEYGTWKSLGPKPVNFFGTSSGRASFVMFDKRDKTGNTIWAGGANGGVWKSTDFGKTWVCKTDALINQSSGSLAIDENPGGANSIMYYGTGEGVWFGGSPYPGVGIYKSVDGGETWKLITKGLPYRTTVHKLIIKPDNTNILFAALQNGLYKSTDRGESWKKIIPDGNIDRQCTDVAISPDGKYVYAVGSREEYFPPHYQGIGYYMSTNGGNTFTKKFLTDKYQGRSKIDICSSEPQYLYILSSMDGPQYLFRSTDRGFTFDQGVEINNAGGNSSYNMMLKADPADHNTFYYGLSSMYKTTNHGNSFCCIGSIGYAGCGEPCAGTNSSNSIHPDYHGMDILEGNSNILAVATDGGIYTSVNAGLTFDQSNSRELVITQFYKFSSSPFNPDRLTGGAQDLGIIYRVNELEWNVSPGQVGDGGNVVASETRPNIMIGNKGGSDPGGVYYSHDGGINFGSSMNYPGLYTDAVFNIPIASHPVQPGVFFMLKNQGTMNKVGDVNVYMSTDDGVNFNGDKPHSSFAADTWAMFISICRSNPDVMYASTGVILKEFYTPSHIYRFENGSWTDMYSYLTGELKDKYISALYADPENDESVYIGIGNLKTSHLYNSNNKGSTWIDIGNGLPDAPVRDIITFYTSCDDRSIAVATDMGVYISDDEGDSWQEFGRGLPKTTVTGFFYNRLNGLLRAGTYGRGLWELDMPDYVYVRDVLILNTANVDVDIIVCNGGKLVIPEGCEVKFREGKGIMINDGGRIEVMTNDKITLTSQTGKWSGITGNFKLSYNIELTNVR